MPKHSTPAASPPPDPDAGRPLVKWFSLFKKDGKWHALACESRGLKILRERVLESDSDRLVVMDAFDKAAREWGVHGVDPFMDRGA